MQRLTVQPSDDLSLRPADLVRPELAAVEEVMREQARSEVELLEEAAHHILDAGGKRLRPQLVLLAAMAMGGAGPLAIQYAAAVELIHTATLVHDDVVDESDSRRGRGTANYFWGNSASVLMGDYLVVRALGLIAAHGDTACVKALTDQIATMCEGEVLQLCLRSDVETSREQYYRIIDCKTASLMALACRLGAMAGGGSVSEQRALAEFGRLMGRAFQITDDILDLFGDERTLGKPVGGDLCEGKVTLPLIVALERARAADRQLLMARLDQTSRLADGEIAEVARVVRYYDGDDEARLQAERFVQEAERCLGEIRPGAARDALHALATRIVDRDR